ncbi:Na(+)/H(+) antiporter subunit C [Geodermatophilus marinus]|uniref:Na(+)/H(+) antiporter subunit C n=1 Tax=Geodermatophilus sp. LHW52908 TaxID=2303986 RepID=UPI000E3C750E|nr:Na(+)/H(+) antiporter subunit C [Geodermatophilus sp. LHW52908]RFU22312.1 Na(+)/H(+) antiporter subunit C [Geodermatophilus sp. LHW52908]
MTPTVVFPVLVAGLYAAGVYLLLDRSLTRVLLGFLLLGNATNLLLLSTSRAGEPPIVGTAEPAEMADPLPQALVLTAIVITFGVSAFLLAVIHRSWRLVRREVVETDEEDRRVAARSPRQGDALDPDDLDPGDLSREERAVGRAVGGPGDDVEHRFGERFPDAASDDVDLPPTRGAAR